MILGAARYSVMERKKTSFHIPPEKTSKWRCCLQIFFQIFFHGLDTAQYGATDSTFIYAFLTGDFPVGLTLDQMGIHPAALDLRQGVESVPEMIETLHAFYQFLRGGLMHTSGILNAIVTVEGIVRLIVADTLGIGSRGQFAGMEYGGHFIGNLNVFVMGVPRVIVFQIDSSHYIFLRSDFCGWWVAF